MIRLNKALEGKVDEYHLLEDKFRSISEYESKILVLGQEIERLNSVLASKMESYKIL